MQNTSFRQKAFSDSAFRFCVEVLQFLQINDDDPRRKVVLDSFVINDSLENVSMFLNAIGALSEKLSSGQWLELTQVLWHLKDQKNVDDFACTLRALADKGQFMAWDELFGSLHYLSNKGEKIWEEYFLTVRNLDVADGFQSWSAFFKATKGLSENAELLSEFLVAARHAPQFYKKKEGLDQIFLAMGQFKEALYFEAFSIGQMRSKAWLVESLHKYIGQELGNIFVLAGWIGTLPRMLFDQERLGISSIRNFDLDIDACSVSEKINRAEVENDWRYKSCAMDILNLVYPSSDYDVSRYDGSKVTLTTSPDLIINTSCEHIREIGRWWGQVSRGTRVVVQSNNATQFRDHVACVASLDEFKSQLPMSKTLYAGELDLGDYRRFMLIGEK